MDRGGHNCRPGGWALPGLLLPELAFSGSSSRMRGSWKCMAGLGVLKQFASVKSITVLLSLGARAESAALRFRANIFSICATGMRKRMRGPSSVGGAAQRSDDDLATSF